MCEKGYEGECFYSHIQIRVQSNIFGQKIVVPLAVKMFCNVYKNHYLRSIQQKDKWMNLSQDAI